jgi:hypothetical protein
MLLVAGIIIICLERKFIANLYICIDINKEDFNMDIKMTLDELIVMLNKLCICHIVERINNDIIHIKIVKNKNNNIFRLRFVDKGFGFEFTNFLEG